MLLTTSKRNILSDFEALAYEQYSGNVPEDVKRLLGRIVNVGLNHGEVDVVAALDKGIVYLVGEITDDSIMHEEGSIIDLILEAHYNLPKEIPLTLVISSGGGSVPAGLALIGLINQVRREGRKVNGHAAGWAMSMAFDILQCCDRRTMEPTAFLMLHEEQYGMEGSTSKHKEEVKFSEQQERSLLQVIADRTGKSVKYYQDKTKNSDWYIGPEEAISEGLIDEVLAVPALPKAVVTPPPAKPKRARRTATASPVRDDSGVPPTTTDVAE